MIAYKGFHGDLTCTLGKGTFRYTPGETITEDRSKCANTGFHCTEYPLECFKWYPPGTGNRYFEVEAGGSIDECQLDAKIACTELTLLRELTVFQLTVRGMMYMVEHPLRDWKISGPGIEAADGQAEAGQPGTVAVARGQSPKVRGVSGAVLGLLCEDQKGNITDAKVVEVKGKVRPGVWYTLENRRLREAMG